MDTKLSLGRPIDDRQSSLAMDQDGFQSLQLVTNLLIDKNDRQSDLFVIFLLRGILCMEGNIMKKELDYLLRC